MADSHSVTFTLTEADVVEASRFVTHRKLFKRQKFALIVGALVLLAIFAIWQGKSALVGILLGIVVATPIWLGLVIFWIVPRHAKRHYQQSVSLKDENTLKWNDLDTILSSAHGETRYKWHEWSGWGESHGLIILFQSESLFNIIPKSAFETSEIEAIKRRLDDAEIPHA